MWRLRYWRIVAVNRTKAWWRRLPERICDALGVMPLEKHERILRYWTERYDELEKMPRVNLVPGAEHLFSVRASDVRIGNSSEVHAMGVTIRAAAIRCYDINPRVDREDFHRGGRERAEARGPQYRVILELIARKEDVYWPGKDPMGDVTFVEGGKRPTARLPKPTESREVNLGEDRLEGI